MEAQALKGSKRKVFGRKVKALRMEGVLPANVYGRKVKSLAVQVATSDFETVFSEVGETGLVDLKINGDTRPVLIHNVQVDPVSGLPIHADFLQVNLKEKVVAAVPLEFTGDSPAEKAGEGVVVEQMGEIEVEALPTDLPEKVVVDVSGLKKVDDAVKVGDLDVDREKVEIKDDSGRVVVNVASPAKEEEVPAPSQEVVETPKGEEGAGGQGDVGAGGSQEGEAKAGVQRETVKREQQAAEDEKDEKKEPAKK